MKDFNKKNSPESQNSDVIVVQLDHLLYALIIFLSVLFLFVGYFMCRSSTLSTRDDQFFQARVIAIHDTLPTEDEIKTTESNSVSSTSDNATADTATDTAATGQGDQVIAERAVYFTAEILKGPLKGRIVAATQNFNTMLPVQPLEVKPGDKIMLIYTKLGDTQSQWLYANHSKTGPLLCLCLFFFAAIVLIGRQKGISTIIALVLSIAAIFLIYIPGILKGYNIYILTIIICTFIVCMTLLFLSGFSYKTLCAIIGNTGGFLLAGILATMMSKVLHFTGLVDQDYIFLTYVNPENPINLKAVLWGGIVIGSLGAVMDIAMSISSAMTELAETMKNKTFANLLRSGMNIGRDSIGTMTNTLILAYIGSSLAVVLLFSAYSKDLLYLVNTEMIAVEIVQSIVGSLGILFAVPITALFSAWIYTRK